MMSGTQSVRSSNRKSSIYSSHFNPENLSENDIEQIWKNLVKSTSYSPVKSSPQVKMMSSVETTPTTDYGDLIPLHPETEEEAIEQDKQLTKMNTTLKAKKLHPKSYLPQVILYDNVSHERLLAMRLNEIRHAHDAVKKRAKQREESFVKLLERKQKEWIKRDSRIISKLEPENISEFNFAFGRLYSKADYPYQTVIEALHRIPIPDRKLDYARKRPIILPQVTNRPIFDDDEEDKTFVTKLPKNRNLSTNQLPSIVNQSSKKNRFDTFEDKSSNVPGVQRHGRGKLKLKQKDWINDKRFHKLTSLLGDRYSSNQIHNSSNPQKIHKTVISHIF